MSEGQEFEIEIAELDRSKRYERLLDDLIYKYLHLNTQIEDPLTATKELIEVYLRVVRGRNKLRRNWHPNKSADCDLATLKWISREEAESLIDKSFKAAETTSSNGSKVIKEEVREQLKKQILDGIYSRVKNRNIISPLEKIVRKIYKSNPDITGAEVISEMRANPSLHGIIEIDDGNFVIQTPQGMGKQTSNKPRSFKSIHNVLARVKARDK